MSRITLPRGRAVELPPICVLSGRTKDVELFETPLSLEVEVGPEPSRVLVLFALGALLGHLLAPHATRERLTEVVALPFSRSALRRRTRRRQFVVGCAVGVPLLVGGAALALGLVVLPRHSETVLASGAAIWLAGSALLIVGGLEHANRGPWPRLVGMDVHALEIDIPSRDAAVAIDAAVTRSGATRGDAWAQVQVIAAISDGAPAAPVTAERPAELRRRSEELAAQGLFDEACYELERLIALAPDDAVAPVRLAELRRSLDRERYWRLAEGNVAVGKLDLAIGNLENLLRRVPEDAVARDRLAELRAASPEAPRAATPGP